MLIRFIMLIFMLLSTTSCAYLTELLDLPSLNDPVITLGTGHMNDVVWLPDGQTLAFASTRGIWLRSIAGSSESMELLTVNGGTQSISFSRTGKYIASVGADGRIWDISSRKQILTIYERDPQETMVSDGRVVRGLSFSPDEKFALATGINIISLWDLSTGDLIFERDASRAEFTLDGESLVISNIIDRQTMLTVWNIAQNEQVWSYPLDDFTNMIQLTPNGQYIITVFDNLNTPEVGLRFWSATTGEVVLTLDNYEFGGRIAQVENNPAHSNMFAFTHHESPFVPGFEASIILWDMESNSVVHTLPGYRSPITDIDFSSDGQFLVTSEESIFETKESYIRLWNVDSGQLIAQSPAFIRDEIREVHFNKDNTIISSTHADGVVRLWDSSNLELLETIGQGTVDAILASSGERVVIGNNSGHLSLSSVNLEAQNISEGASVQSEFLPLNNIASDVSLSVVSFATGNSFDNEVDGRVHTLQLWNPISNTLATLFESETEGIGAIAINPDGTLLAAVMSDGVSLWDIETGKQLDHRFTGATDYIVTLEFSPDGQLLASGGCGGRDVEGTCNSGEINVWRILDYSRIHDPIHDHTSAVYALDFSPDGAKLFSGSGGSIYFGSLSDYSIASWDIESGNRVGNLALDHTGQITALSLDSTGERLFSGSGNSVFGYDSSIIMWNATSLKPLAILQNSAPPLADLAITEDRSQLISVHNDGTIRVWDVMLND